MKKLVLSLIALSCATTLFAQGSLTPPGSPAPTMKTLQQVEPRIDLATVAGDSTYYHVITEPGSYYLSRNLVVSKLTNGVWINASGVTLDLNGFEISGVSGTSYSGIYISTTGDGATVRNGSITGFSYGIYSDGAAEGVLFEKLSVSACSNFGIRVWGESSRIIDCRVFNNLGDGISVGTGSTLNGCTAYGNQGTGIAVGLGSTLSDCTANGNQGSYGIYAADGSTLSGCTAYENTGSGTSGSTGIYAGSGCTVVECTARRNSHTNPEATISDGIGIFANPGSLVKNCTVSLNRDAGILVIANSSVVGNSCDSNGTNGDGAGIHAIGSDNRIDGNNVTDNDRGIEVDSSGNLIVRNSASGNTITQYDIATGNDTGTIKTTPVGAGAWDNFSF